MKQNINSYWRNQYNNRFDLSNPLSRSLQEQQSKLRAKPSLRSGTDLQVKRMLYEPKAIVERKNMNHIG
jgi:hypothetical protein